MRVGVIFHFLSPLAMYRGAEMRRAASVARRASASLVTGGTATASAVRAVVAGVAGSARAASITGATRLVSTRTPAHDGDST